MTIAGCYLTPEGVVFGADSTSSFPCDTGMHYFDFNQKIFEIGEGNTLGLVTWGLGGLNGTSYRTLLAQFADDLQANPANSVADVAQRWVDKFWPAFLADPASQALTTLHAKAPHDPNLQTPDPARRSVQEESQYQDLRATMFVGFCIAGYVLPDRTPTAAVMVFDVLAGRPTPYVSTEENQYWWGVPNIIQRLILGADENLRHAVLTSGFWSGSEGDFDNVVRQQTLSKPTLPIRDAIDYVHSCIHCTIKAMKFSTMAQICGGPIEVAVITTDRRFRWVRHKPWDAAITDGAL